MKFFNSHRKGIALLALFSFFYLLHFSSMPLKAAPAPEPVKANVSADEDSPGAIEQQGPVTYKSGKKSPLVPIIIAVLAVGAIAAVLILVVFKTKYDITGTWTLTISVGSNYNDLTYEITFTGGKGSGNFTDDGGYVGEYSVDGKKVHFEYTDTEVDLTFDGQFDDKNNMSGNVNGTLYESGTSNPVPLNNRPWDAGRGVAPQSHPKSLSAPQLKKTVR